jgi:mono/diheme cytochrome c family protein
MNDAPRLKHDANKSIALPLLAGLAAVIFASGAIIVTTSRTAQATPQFATQTGLSCGQCHVSAGGGGPLKAFGKRFKANGNKLPGKK